MSVFSSLMHGRQKGSQHAFNLRPFELEVSQNDGIETSIITRRQNVAALPREKYIFYLLAQEMSNQYILNWSKGRPIYIELVQRPTNIYWQ